MEIKTNKENASMTCVITGRIDTMTAPEVEREVMSNLDGVTELTLDFENVEYISSAGLRVLLSAQKQMNKQGDMRLIHVRDEVQEVFDITGFSDILTVE